MYSKQLCIIQTYKVGTTRPVDEPILLICCVNLLSKHSEARIKSCMGRGGGLVVSVLTCFSDTLSLHPAQAYSFL